MISVVLCLGEHLEEHGFARSEIGPDGLRRFRRAEPGLPG